MATKTLSISESAYNRLTALKTSKKESFSDVILKYYPKKKKLSDLLCEISPNPELADAIENASKSMRKANMRKVDL